MKRISIAVVGIISVVTVFFALIGLLAFAPLPVTDDPLIRMPGTQQNDGASLRTSDGCLNCHAGYNTNVEPGFNWNSSMMSQSARDPIFWATLTVSAQDSIYLIDRPNATDLCLRCHMPAGWLQGRSDPTNAAAMVDADFNGVECVYCHYSADPLFVNTANGSREGDDWNGYWDEASSLSLDLAAVTYSDDQTIMAGISAFNGDPFFDGSYQSVSSNWDEAGAGQYFVSLTDSRRAAFADPAARHAINYSRFHKSKYFCNTCHDVSNPAFSNIGAEGRLPGDGGDLLPSEINPAYSYGHVERTFSEFMLSAYAKPGGADGIGPYNPAIYDTSMPGNKIASCQNCHMSTAYGKGCNKNDGVMRPDESLEHPNSGQPVHQFTGGNAFVTYLLASTQPDAPNYDAHNQSLLSQGKDVLTMDISSGLGIDGTAMYSGHLRAIETLGFAADIHNTSYDPDSGELHFRIQNNTAHKLPSGYPEGRRIFVNVKLYDGEALVQEVNPYDTAVHTLKGLSTSYSPDSPPLSSTEIYDDDLVYEMQAHSSIIPTPGETFHFVLADGRYKDNRIPPKGFDIANAETRLTRPVSQGTAAPDMFSSAEYAGGYQNIALNLNPGADTVKISLLYQTTSREFIQFLRDEINGDATSLNPEDYIIQDGSEPFFDGLRAWGDTIWDLWIYNADVPGAAPVPIASVTYEVSPCVPSTETCDGIDNDCNDDIDEDFTTLGHICTVGTGICENNGTLICNSNGDGVECSTTPLPSQSEICDYLDNDCDGDIDETFDLLGDPCVEGVGECEATGVWECVGGTMDCSASPLSPNAESCDFLDNDCDGVVDNGCACVDGQTQTCYTGPAGTIDIGLCQSGIQTCIDGAFGSCDGEIIPIAESCDNTDNDCDGVVDDGVLSSCGDCNPVPPDICDGIDNDCDGSIDEHFTTLDDVCTVGIGACENHGVYICNNSGDGVNCDASALTASPEICDGLDNDCDGSVDEEFAGLGESCRVGIGECATYGSYVCDGTTVRCDAVAGNATAEICDGRDNDCDGNIDNGFNTLGTGCTAGLGACVSTGLYQCSLDGSTTECDAVTSMPTPELCDNIDNDCDGIIDNGCACTSGELRACYSGPVGSEGIGVCIGGTQSCVDGAWNNCSGEILPTAERCDNEDNDCDGEIDENFDVDNYCSSGIGECAWGGNTVCTVDELRTECDADAGAPSPELCDGVDNDCDGNIDEDFVGLSSNCSIGTGECQAHGIWDCSNDGTELQCSATVFEPGSELCDRRDNDCDGSVDEDFPLYGQPCTVGIGECAASGSYVCAVNQTRTTCDATPLAASAEVCDTVDNDCDGLVDEGFEDGQSCNDSNPCSYDDQYVDCNCEGTTYSCIPGSCETSSLCNGLGGCTIEWSTIGTTCDDNNPSTTSDACDGLGNCLGVTDTGADSGSDTGFDTDTDADSDTGTNADSDTGKGVDSDTGADSNTDSDTSRSDTTDTGITNTGDTDSDPAIYGASSDDGCGCQVNGAVPPSIWALLLQLFY